MRLERGKPPIFDEVVRVIGRPPPGAILTWGDVMYYPVPPPRGMKMEVDPWLLEHETTHSRQQAIMGGPATWWRWYLDDVAFRLQQELAAYRNQYQAAATVLGRPGRRELQRKLGRDLAGAMYGHIIGREAAIQAIVHG